MLLPEFCFDPSFLLTFAAFTHLPSNLLTNPKVDFGISYNGRRIAPFILFSSGTL